MITTKTFTVTDLAGGYEWGQKIVADSMDEDEARSCTDYMVVQ